jgi:hypothetical protein
MVKTDRKLAALSQKWEVRYVARKFRVTNLEAARVFKRVGRSRKRVYEAMRKLAAQHRRLRRLRAA